LGEPEKSFELLILGFRFGKMLETPTRNAMAAYQFFLDQDAISAVRFKVSNLNKPVQWRIVHNLIKDKPRPECFNRRTRNASPCGPAESYGAPSSMNVLAIIW
jgi:hypothetical protein